MLNCVELLKFLVLLKLAFAKLPSTRYSGRLWNATYTDLLKRDLLNSYDKFARPIQHTNTTVVDIDLEIKHIDLDDTKCLLTVNAWVKLSWFDGKLRWDAAAYGDLDVLHLADHEVWEPDIALYNSALGNNMDHYGNTHLLAYPNGDVLWVPPAQFSVFCNLDLSKWPFDKHTCTLILGSWTYNGEQVDLRTKGTKVSAHVETNEWEIIEVVKRRNERRYSCCNESYVDVQFNVTIKRRSTAYYPVVITPAFALVMLTLGVFWLPPHAIEKFLVSGLTALLICIFLIYFAQRLPVMGVNTPLIVVFYSYHLIMVVISMLISVITYNLHQSSSPVPWYIASILRGPLASVLGVQNKKMHYDEEMTGTGEELRQYEDNQGDRRLLTGSGIRQWTLVAKAVDRVMFTIYVITFTSLALRCFL
ncbi:acetylcholine receptor subunit alpha-like isoform X2 [Rhodnius prolixus]